ncbi:MAG: DUF86 domain-containing protein [Rhodobacteraceae bacterium]|nr:DUF86 domain-containing protein [Paracoccaceae bacterium]
MRTNPQKLLYDILTCCEETRQFTAGMDRRKWLDDLMARRAVERDFGIIGEAIKRIRDHHPELAARIPGLPRITGFRDRLAHEYEDIDSVEVWGYFQNNLPTLEKSIQGLMVELEPPKKPDGEGKPESSPPSSTGPRM